MATKTNGKGASCLQVFITALALLIILMVAVILAMIVAGKLGITGEILWLIR